MGLFKKKAIKKEINELPELPKLPSLLGESEFGTTLPQLPRYPPNSLNNKFSQNTINDEQKAGNFLTNFTGNKIKDAISGKKEEEVEADEFAREQMMPELSEIKPSDFARLNPEGKFEKSEGSREPSRSFEFPYKMEKPLKNLELRGWQEPKTKKTGEVFIKIDKFEESLKIFEMTKDKIVEMEKMLEDIKELKEKEEKELSYWMSEIQTIKNQTEKVERDIFSKLE